MRDREALRNELVAKAEEERRWVEEHVPRSDFGSKEEWDAFVTNAHTLEVERLRGTSAQDSLDSMFGGIPFPDCSLVTHYLHRRLVAALPKLEDLLERVDSHGASEDLVYRFYHQSFKVYGLNGPTAGIVKALQAVLPYQPLNKWFLQIVKEASGKEWDNSRASAINANWLSETRPVVEAFFHARYFLSMAIKYAKGLKEPPRLLPSGWAAVLHLYGLR